ncbi:MAG: 2,3-bisphosphoglycerate-independent phosphoglycerate mutase [Candidatus Moranbacteria bacterium]|nr:2,3-bisphosphoglycerate-independent phosphoglycerate mutase [Candidatus Moranbacteria bacterium]
MYRPIILIILDGWGINTSDSNVTNQINLPTFDILKNNYPMIALQASGISVGLPWGKPGNSEVGHTTLGLGRIVYQNFPRISLAIQNGSFATNSAFMETFENIKNKKGDLHLIGLIGDGYVHSSREHLYELVKLAKINGVKNIFIHCFTDGRDSSPTAFTRVYKEMNEEINEIGAGKIATIIGRNWAMDRNNNWERIEKAYKMLVNGEGEKTTDPLSIIEQSYENKITDEFLEPIILADRKGEPLTKIKDGDGIVYINFREDRARQLTQVFTDKNFDKFNVDNKPNVTFLTMTEYDESFPAKVAFPPIEKTNSLGEVLSKNNLKQLRIAETEKYAHVTYFFNGGGEEIWPGEDRVVIPSKAVKTFDEKPEMQAREITKKIINFVNEKKYDFILVNYANADMIAHTGNEEAAKEAAKVLDECLKNLSDVVLRKNGCMLITADHGNIEVMKNPHTGEVDTQHNTSPVPLWFVSPDNQRRKSEGQILNEQVSIRGILSDVAPTILELLEIKKPLEMQGESLLPIFEE